MATATEQTPVELAEKALAEAKTAETEAKATAKSAKAEAASAKKAVVAAEKASKGLEGDELAAAEKKVDEAKDAQATADAAAAQAVAAVAPAGEQVKAARKGVTDAKKAADAEEKAKRAEERKNRPKKASLTLSQRRALLKLGEGPVEVVTAMNRQPLDYLVSVELAEVKEDERTTSTTTGEGDEAKTVESKTTVYAYSLTEKGTERVKEINPKWLTWKPERGEAASNGDAPAEAPATDE